MHLKILAPQGHEAVEPRAPAAPDRMSY
jgi:hypothetical protein